MTPTVGRNAARTTPGARRRLVVFLILWVASSAVIGTMVLDARRIEAPSVINGAVSTGLLLATTAALWAWLGPVPTHGLAAAKVTRRTGFTLVVAVVVVVLLGGGVAGRAALVGLAVVATGVLLRWREPLNRREVAVAVLLGGVATVAGVAEAWARSDAAGVVFGVFQLPLVALTLLAGWRLARRCGWDAAGLGPVVALGDGPGQAVRAGAVGLVLALPWALGNVVNGAPSGDDMRTVWQPVAAALQPGVAEEAWARAFLIPALYALFAGAARARPALLTAVVVAVYWFAFLHAPTDPLFVLGVGTVYALPLALLWLRWGLEVAIGFHVGLDLARYAAAYLTAEGMWFG